LLFTLLFALALSPLPYQSAQAPDFPKSEAPTPQSTLHAKVSRVKIGGNVAKSLLKHKVQPRYPKEARDNRIQGTVRLHVVLSTAGKVQQLELVSGDPVLAKAALDAVRQWEYKPTLLNGEPVEVDTTVDVVFSLVQ
jgi:protein TonB